MWFDYDEVVERCGSNSQLDFERYFGINFVPFTEEDLRRLRVCLQKEQEFPDEEVVISNLILLEKICPAIYEKPLKLRTNVLNNPLLIKDIFNALKEEQFDEWRSNNMFQDADRNYFDNWNKELDCIFK